MEGMDPQHRYPNLGFRTIQRHPRTRTRIS
ncbi:uncharacterized protein G2W53_018136 [Senna tora]|uniref:Uncharacterized protein n=1 Tax=Senna tora TaxID=362788 RepID=A0A834WL34_9FABA|nr:uncharacterized protein G2W53_018136 [Senna tora]